MLKKLIVACSIALGALGVLGGTAALAPAEAGVKVYFGVPFHPYRVGPGWRYYDGYGWYDYGRYGEFRPYRARMTCGEARRLVDRSGYYNVDARDCTGSTYVFRATNYKGRRVDVYVNSRTGALWR